MCTAAGHTQFSAWYANGHSHCVLSKISMFYIDVVRCVSCDNNFDCKLHLLQVIESRDRSQDDPYGNTTVQACDAVRVSVLVRPSVDVAAAAQIVSQGCSVHGSTAIKLFS